VSPTRRAAHHLRVARETDLLTRFRRDGDAAAMEEFVGATRSRLLAVARRIGATQDAEDTVEAAYHALLRRTDLPADADPVGWLVTATVRIAYRRKAVARRDAGLAERLKRSREDAGPAANMIRGEEDALVRRAVHRLPASYRDAIVLHHLEEVPLADVARLLDVPESTAKTRVQRGRALLRWRLAPLATYGLLVVPWMVADAVRSAAATPLVRLGGAMKAKTALAVSLAAAFAAGAGTGSLATTALRPAPDTVPTPAASPARAATAPPNRVRAGGPAEAAAPAPAAPSSAASSPPAPVAAGKPSDNVPDAVVRAATDLGVSEGALRAAMAAYAKVLSQEREDAVKPALATLHGFGEDGFRAVVAMLRGGIASTATERLVEASWSPGGERLLMELAESRPSGDAQYVPHVALWCLGSADTPAVREWLLARAASETDPSRCMNVTHALGRLKEARGIALCQDKLAKRDDLDWNAAWNEVIRAYILGDVARMARGDPDAGKRAFVTYLRDEGADRIDWAIRSLRDLDPAAAKGEAAALLAGPRAKSFNTDTISALRDVAK
jgi:RNA polymerase sigma-70 factor, ECF subfamily